MDIELSTEDLDLIDAVRHAAEDLQIVFDYELDPRNADPTLSIFYEPPDDTEQGDG